MTVRVAKPLPNDRAGGPARLRRAHRGAEGSMGQWVPGLEHGVESGGWLRYGSTTARGEIRIAGVPPRGPGCSRSIRLLR